MSVLKKKVSVVCFSGEVPVLKELRHDILGRFLRRAKLASMSGKPQKISLVKQKNTKMGRTNQKGTKMVKDGED